MGEASAREESRVKAARGPEWHQARTQFLFVVVVFAIILTALAHWTATRSAEIRFLGDRADSYVDLQGTATLADLTGPLAGAFLVATGRMANRGIIGDGREVFWLRIAAPALEDPPDRRFALSLQETRVRAATLTVVGPDGAVRANFTVLPGRVNAEGFVSRFATFSVTAAELEGATLYLAINTRSSKRALVFLEPEAGFEANERRQTLMFGILFGIQLGLFVYLLAMALVLREASFGWLAALVGVYCVYAIADRAFFESLIAPGELLVSRVMSFAGTFGAYATWMAFLVHYMRLPAHSPRLARMGNAIVLVAVALAIIAVPVVLTDATWLRAISSQFGIVVLVTGFGFVALSARAEPARAWAYIACWSPTAIATLARLWLDAAPGQGGILSVYGVYVAAVYSMLSFAIILSVDIQDRETRLRRIAERNEARFQGFARAASDGFLELDDDNRLLLATGPQVDWRLSERPGWIEALTRIALHEDDPALATLQRAMSAREPFRAVELAVTPPPGQGSLTLELSGEPFEEVGRRGYRGIIADVTERRVRQEREVRQGRMAAIGQLSSGMAHEINNLLHPIINLARRVRDRLDADPEGRAYLQVVLDSGHRASDILSRVLRSVHPSNTETVAQLPFATAFADVATEIGGLLPGRVRLLVAITAEGGPLVSTTEAFQVLSNLVTNAVDANGGQGEIKLEVESVGLATGRTLRLVVADSGTGMSAEAMARATEPFFTTKPQGKGTGLGLAMVRQIVHSWGGTLRFDSTPGDGTRVIVEVPEPARDTARGPQALVV